MPPLCTNELLYSHHSLLLGDTLHNESLIRLWTLGGFFPVSWGRLNWPARGPSELKVIRIVRQSNLLIDNQLYLIPVPALRVSGFTLASTAVLSRVKPRARPAGTLYKSITHRPIYGFNHLITLCCPVFSDLRRSARFARPPVAALHSLVSQTVTCTKEKNIQSVVIFFFFRIGGCASKIYIFLHAR